ncbi:MAG: putative cell wall anchored protein [Eubacterium sp.]|nr:putative cell wall anchored protein [Eubacterium sp.]
MLKMSSRFFKAVICILIIVVVTVSSTQGVYMASVSDALKSEANEADKAETKDEKDIITPEDSLLSSVKNILETTEEPTGIKPQLPKSAYTTDFNWDSPQTLRGIYSSTELYFTLPEYWDTKYACVRLEYRVSQLIRETPCTLTFSINKQPFYSCNITYKSNETDFIYVLIPKELLKNDKESRSNTLLISGYARLYNEQGCIDDDSNANWLTITDASGVEAGYDLKPHNNRIDYYPYPFMSSEIKTGSNTLITVANASQNEEVSTAMMIMSHLSKNTSGKNNLSVSSWEGSQNGKSSSRIIVGLTKNLPGDLLGKIEPYRSQLKGQAMILFTSDASNKPLLLITSEDADCLAEAGFFLADADRVDQEKDSVTFIKKGTAEIKINAVKQSDVKADRYTLQEMTGGGFEFIGPFHQVKTLFLPIPSDYTLSSASKVTVNFRYSKNLDFKRSMLTVYWGDIPVGSKKLSLEKADNDELTFFMPADVVGTKAGSIKFAFDLEIPDLFCTTRRDEMPWAYISKNSSIYLPFDSNIRLSFDSRPSPFQRNGSLNEVLLVLSDKPSSEELTLLGRTLALYSKTADTYGTLKVVKAGEFNEKEANYNIITSGTPAANSLIQKINDNLYFKYNSTGTEFMTNEKLILTTDYAKSIGTLQLLKSPFAEGRAMLVLTGPDNNSLKMVSKIVSNEKTGWNLSKDFVLIDTEGNIKAYQFQNYEIKEKNPTIVQSVTQNKNSLLFALAGTSVMVVLFLAMILIFIRMKQNKKPH